MYFSVKMDSLINSNCTFLLHESVILENLWAWQGKAKYRSPTFPIPVRSSIIYHRYYIAYGLGLDTALREHIATIHYRVHTSCCA